MIDLKYLEPHLSARLCPAHPVPAPAQHAEAWDVPVLPHLRTQGHLAQLVYTKDSTGQRDISRRHSFGAGVGSLPQPQRKPTIAWMDAGYLSMDGMKNDHYQWTE